MSPNTQPTNPNTAAAPAPAEAAPAQPTQAAEASQAPQMQAPQMQAQPMTMPQAPQAGPPAPPAWASGKGTSKSVMAASLTALIAGAVSIFLLPYIAGAIGVISGAQAINQYRKAVKSGDQVSGGVLAMAIIGIVLGALGIVLAILVQALRFM
ncbi:hypothetical protein G7067_01025 [Leucobacter insecticola]|uniref:DUF4190 domain-containing protein n=1 Tax=Leucobacter insecticola TaxID=2714934 RepID=A0A6G8FFQ1_9MICO|nr:hypothetical protein [Leucobacter insecticola]QIM15316.1 hypothetical protein G7067_01025 [Leucobacter insecticola]